MGVDVTVFLFAVAVAFVEGVHVPDGVAVRPDGGDDLFGFGDGDAGVVLALDDEEGDFDFVDVGEGAEFLEVHTHGGDAFVAVFDTTEVAAIVLGVFEEGDEVGDADDVDGGLKAIAVVDGAGEDHVAAVAAAVDDDTVLIEIRLSGDPIEEGADVFDGVFAFVAVVEAEVGFAVSRGCLLYTSDAADE